MKNRPEIVRGSAKRKVHLLILAGLTFSGFAANYFGYEVFFGIDFIFGSIFSMLALQLFGLPGGLPAAFFMSLSVWNHPYGVILFSAEALGVGLLYKRRVGFVLADSVFWLCIGMPLVYIFCRFFMHLPPADATFTMLKHALNGIANALLARLIFMAASARTGRHSFPFREVVFNILALFILISSLVFPGIHSRIELPAAEKAARTALELAGKRIPLAVADWLQSRHEKIVHLASMAAVRPAPFMQRLIEKTKRDEPDFLRIGLLDAKATIIAFAPQVDDLGQKIIGRNYADRPYIPVLKKTLQPLLSEVVMGRVGVPKPAVSEVAPVVRAGRYAGYAIGVLKLESVRDMIGLYLKDPSLPGADFILLDKNRKVIVSSRDELKTMDNFVPPPGEIEEIEPGLMQRIPARTGRRSDSDSRKHAVYFNETRIGGMAEWTLVLEQPAAAFQKRMYRHYAGELTAVFFIFLAALGAAELVSRRMVRTFTDLYLLSSEIPKQISSGREIPWPTSRIAETEHLIHNFRDMAQVIALQFHKIRVMNAELEERVEERTRELKKSEERLNKAQRVAKVGNWEWNIEANEVAWSEEVYRLYGADLRTEKASYDIVLRTLAPECRERFRSAVEDAVKENRPFEGEYRIIGLDGTERYTHTVGEVVRDKEGRPLSMFGVVQDITDRKKAEEKLIHAKNLMQYIISHAQSAIAVHDRDMTYIFVSEQYLRQYKVKEQDALGKHHYDVFPDLPQKWRDVHQRVLAGAVERGEEDPYVREDGSVDWTRWECRPWYEADGSIGGLIVYTEVITERKRREDALRQLAAEQRIILDSVATGIMYVKNRKAVWANPAFYRMYGYGQEEFQGSDTRRLYADSADYERVGREGYARLATGDSFSLEMLSVKKDGGRIWVSLIGRAVNPDDPVEGSIWMFQEITERKNAEAAMQERTRQLESLTRDLEKMVEEEIAMRFRNEQILVQQSKLASMGQMIGAIAHQWRQPLNALGLMVQDLKDAHVYGELDGKYLQETVRKSMDQIQHMSKTIDDFRNFFQPDKERSVFDTMQAVGFVLRLLSAQLAANDIECTLTCHTHGKTTTDIEKIASCEEKTINGYRNEFEHVILNLINNARDAIQERREQKGPLRGSLTIDFYNRDGKIIISVSDNGGGIDAGILERIFEPYFTTKGPAKGTGLGLYMCKVIIEDHFKGKLAAQNIGDGAAFTIELPQAG